MPSKESITSRASFLFFMPSFFGAVTWASWLLLYHARILDWNEDSEISVIIFWGVELAFIASIFAFAPYYKAWTRDHFRALEVEESASPKSRLSTGFLLLIAILHLLGFLGTTLYVRDFGLSLGGLRELAYLAWNKSWIIRWEAEYTLSPGTQLGYFGWIATGFTVYEVTRGRLSRWWLVPAVVQFAGNFLWIARTRPTWILVTAGLMGLVALRRANFTTFLKWGVLTVCAIFVMYFSIGVWVGKIYARPGDTSISISQYTDSAYVYGTGGFAYFNELLIRAKHSSLSYEHILYTPLKILAALGLAKQPPSYIPAYFYIPYVTNAATFLDPFYRDGGLPYVFLGTLVQSFGVNALGLFLLQTRRPASFWAWAALCFTSLFAFFVNRIIEPPVWLFTVIGIPSVFLFRPRKASAATPWISSNRAQLFQHEAAIKAPLRRFHR